MQKTKISQCDGCAHLLFAPFSDPTDKAVCRAFMDGIPDEIFWGGADHRTPVEGDGGIVFTQMPGRESVMLAWAAQEAG